MHLGKELAMDDSDPMIAPPRTRTVPLIRERLTKAGKLVVVDMA
jgi:hypothetical protein